MKITEIADDALSNLSSILQEPRFYEYTPINLLQMKYLRRALDRRGIKSSVAKISRDFERGGFWIYTPLKTDLYRRRNAG